MTKRRTLRERADKFAEWNCEYLQYDAVGYRRIHESEDFAASSGAWFAGYRAALRRRK